MIGHSYSYKSESAQLLLKAIRDDDVALARQAFDKAFWKKEPLKPDGFHLFLALKAENSRALVRLLVNNGAAFPPADIPAIALLFGDDWARCRKDLFAAGLKIPAFAAFSAQDHAVAAQMAGDILSVSLDLKLKLHPEVEKNLRDFVRETTLMLFEKGENMALRRVLASRHADKDLSDEVLHILKAHPENTEALEKFLDIVRNAYLNPVYSKRDKIKNAVSARAMNNPQALLPLYQGKVLNGATIFEIYASAVFLGKKPDPAAYAATIKTMLDSGCGPDTQALLSLYHRMKEVKPEAALDLAGALADIGAFADRRWTEYHMRQLNEWSIENSRPRHAAIFNAAAVKKRYDVQDNGLFARILSDEELARIQKAHDDKIYALTPAQTVAVMDFLFKKKAIAKGHIDQKTQAFLKSLKDGGAYTGVLSPERYLGSEKPGLAKALLDLGMVQPDDFDAFGLSMKYIEKIEKGDTAFKSYKQFYSQVFLEKQFPAYYVPFRGTAIDYAYWKDKSLYHGEYPDQKKEMAKLEKPKKESFFKSRPFGKW